MAPRFLDRLLGRTAAEPLPAPIEPKRLMPVSAEVQDPPETKSSLALLPQGAYGANYMFFSPDGGRTMLDVVDSSLTIAFIAYWYVATRWRAQKFAEPPLMVVEEDQESGAEKWLDDHELVPILEEPSPDYDMGELLECTSHYLDNTGAALWVKDTDNVGRIARLTPFSRNEFEIERSNDRLFSSFRVNTADGPQTFSADEVVFFRDAYGSAAWGRGRSRLDVAMSWLKLGARAQQTIYDLLHNSVWPSAVIVPDKEWDPDPKTYEEYKQDIQAYARGGSKGKPFIALGGGQFIPLQSQIKNLVPSEVLGRVESVVAAVSGVPAIVLQFQIGLENSPWSQMAQARRMAYDDCIAPMWRRAERVLTRQMLRLVDDDTTHFMRFDPSNVESLQVDQMQQVQIASLMGRQASLNERRFVMGLEPVSEEDDPDGRADQIPELKQPSIAELLAGSPGANSGGNAGATEDGAGEGDQQDERKALIQRLSVVIGVSSERVERKIRVAGLQDGFRADAVPLYVAQAERQLKRDAERIAEIVMQTLLDESESKGIESKKRGKDHTMKAVNRYLSEDGRKAWTRAIQPLNEAAATKSGALVSSDLGVNFGLLHNNLLTYARKQTGKMVTDVNKTTQSLISDIIQGGIDAKKSTREIARVISEATGFDRSRAELIARTETTKVFNGAPTESLSVLSQSSKRSFTKTWSGVLDDRERDEHVAMEGETVGIDEEFSNGLQYPSEPNCRCTLLYEDVTED